MKIKILIADDHPLVRRGFSQALSVLGITENIIEAENGEEAIRLSNENIIDLFFLDFKMPKIDGYDTARILLKKNEKAKIIVFSSYDEPPLIVNLFRLGVKGFLAKNTDVDEIGEAIQNVFFKGDLYYNKVFERIVTSELYKKNSSFALKFSERETSLVRLISKGKTSREIASIWGLAQKSIETYRSRLLEKVGAKNTSELLTYFHQNGLL